MIFASNPPPTSGATSSISSDDRPSKRHNPNLSATGAWVDAQILMCRRGAFQSREQAATFKRTRQAAFD